MKIIMPRYKSYLMNIFLKFGKLPDKPQDIISKDSGTIDEDWKLLANRNSLENLHLAILISSLFCIIIMFLPKMLINYSRAKKKTNLRNPANNNINQQNDEILIMNGENLLIVNRAVEAFF